MDIQTFTLTFGDIAENNVGMQKIGQLSAAGFTLEDLIKAKEKFENTRVKCELYHLNGLLPPETQPPADNAYILIVRKGLEPLISPHTCEEFFNEQLLLDKDKKAMMRGRVVNKRARYNLCFGDEDQEANYSQGKGTIVAFKRVPLLNHVRERLSEFIGEKARHLVAEGNYYYDINTCYIGYHGDSERRKVIAIRVGATFPLYYQWYLKSTVLGDKGQFYLNNGDIYIMSEKAVGTDWKKTSILTLRHAAGYIMG